jgi:hypothetical protein
MREISQVVRGTAMKGCPQDQAAAQDNSIRTISHHSKRFSARTYPRPLVGARVIAS